MNEKPAGTSAEQYALGAIILDSKQYRFAAEIITADDFSDPRMGPVFSGIGNMVAMGEAVDQISVSNHWPDWGIRGLNPSLVFEWAHSDIRPFMVRQYARAVKEDSVRRSMRYMIETINQTVNDPSVSAMTAVAAAATMLESIRSGTLNDGMQPKPLSEVLKGEDSYDWLIPGILERMDRLVMTGSEGVGKTTFVRQMAVCVAAGLHPLTFTEIQPLQVLVVDAENTERQWRRETRSMVDKATSWGVCDPSTEIQLLAGKRIDITRGPHLAQIHDLIDIHKPDILFIGPLYKLVPKAITNDDDAAPLIVALDSLRERNLALVMEAHAGKSSGGDGERDLRPRGSAALLGWPEFGMGLRTTEDSNVVSLIRWRGDRDQREWPRYFYKGGDFPWTPAHQDPRP